MAVVVPGTPFEQLPAWARVSFHLAGHVPAFLIAVATLGLMGASESMCQTWAGLLRATWSPRGDGATVVGNYAALIITGELLTSLGVLSAVFCAVNLLPLPPLSGGMLLFELLGIVCGRRVAERAYVLAGLVGLLAFLAIIGCWGVAVFTVLVG